MITNHTQLIQALIDKYNLKSYCEVGVQSTAQNFDKINCALKIGVDPALMSNFTNPNAKIISAESDYFFEENKRVFEILFLDGDHTKEQIKRDFENSLRCLSDHGFIVIHDVLPENEEGTKVPRETKQWWGDVYKFAMSISNYSGIGYKTFNIDNGCMLVWKNGLEIKNNNKVYANTYTEYLAIGKALMNVTDEVII